MIIKLSFPEYGCITGCDLHNSLIININRGAGGIRTFSYDLNKYLKITHLLYFLFL